MKRKTIEDLIQSKNPFLRAEDVAGILGVNPQSIRDQAHSDPRALGFPVSVIGSSTLIPRLPFLDFIGVKEVVT